VAVISEADRPAPPLRVRGDFEAIYRAQVKPITAYFARRARDPHAVADLTAETFVEAISSFRTSPPRQGAERAWLFAIARHVYAQHCEQRARRGEAARRASGDRELDEQVVEDLLERIDSERRGRELLERLGGLSSGEREALELVDIAGLAPREAAQALGLSASALRVRLFRARARLRREHGDVEL
jgi:RNA polymerase sigma factor (sigma-70 family)